MRATTRSTLLCFALAAGCTCGKTADAPSPAPPPVESESVEPPPDDGFLYAPLRVREAAAPARFEAALPATVEGFRRGWGSSQPPRAYVKDRLCAGDAAMGDRFAAAVDAASEAGAPVHELMSVHGRMIEYCGAGAFCEWAARQVTDEARSPAFRSVLWVGLGECPNETVEPLLASDGVPPQAVVRFHRRRVFARRAERLPLPDGLVEAARAVVQVEGDFEADRQARMAVDTLARMEGGASALLAMHADLEAQRDRIGLALSGAEDPRLARLFEAACAHQPDARECERDPRPTGRTTVAEPDTEPDTPATLVRAFDFDAHEYLGAHADEREAVLSALEACGRGSGYEAQRCLAQLARVDWSRARGVAQARSSVPDGPEGEVLRTLRAHDRPDGLAARLVEVGLIADPPEEPALTVEEALSSAGTLHRFDTETGMFPNEHDSLLRELAALAPDVLDGVLFVEVAPGASGGGLDLGDGTSLRPDSLDDALDDEGPYTLVAYMDGHAYTTMAENLGDWFDVRAVVGMLNELARRRHDDTRWQVLPTGDQTATVLAAPGPAIRRAMREGLIEGADADQARQDGRAFEERAIEALRRQGL